MAKKEPFKAYKVQLKGKAKTFAEQMFINLFTEATFQIKSINKARKVLDECADDFGIAGKSDKIFKVLKRALPDIRKELDRDAIAFEKKDPAVKSLDEVYIAYPGFFAIAIYRLAHQISIMNVSLLPRLMTEYAHSVTGIDIHPSAQIGHSFFIDHGTGIVIGETTIIGNNVSMYQGVTLGGIKIKKNLATLKRHPTIEDDVTIYANATILGGNITIGANSTIGANVWIVDSIPSNSLVMNKSSKKVKQKDDEQ